MFFPPGNQKCVCVIFLGDSVSRLHTVLKHQFLSIKRFLMIILGVKIVIWSFILFEF